MKYKSPDATTPSDINKHRSKKNNEIAFLQIIYQIKIQPRNIRRFIHLTAIDLSKKSPPTI